MNREAMIAVAKRACEMGGIGENAARAFALLAVAEALLDDAERCEISASYADTSGYRRHDLLEAKRLRDKADELRSEADAIQH